MQPLPGDDLRARKERLAAAIAEKRRRDERAAQSNPYGGLLAFIRYFWHVIEPGRALIEGWPLEALCIHLESITRGEVTDERTFTRLLANVPPGFMKSLTLNVFWPAWEWGPMGLPHLRYIAFSYAAHLTERDNERFRDLVRSLDYQELWGHVFTLTSEGKIKVQNDKQGFKFASSIGGVGTGERGDRVLLDDPHHVHQAESEVMRKNTVRWFRESMSNRLNSMRDSVIVVIMQRVHMEDVSGAILEDGGYVHLCIPFDYETARHCQTVLKRDENGEPELIWEDPRTKDGETPWDDRFSATEMEPFRRRRFLWAGQYQQSPIPRGGGLIKEHWWQIHQVQEKLDPHTKKPIGGYKFVPEFVPEFVVAALDTAFTEKEENSYSAMTVWAVYPDPKTRHVRILLVDAWQKHLEMHGDAADRAPDESEGAYLHRATPKWGLVEWVNYTCTRRRVDVLLIENKSRGHDVNREIRRLFAGRNFGIRMVDPKRDKWARMHAIVDVFTDEMIYAPALIAEDGGVRWLDFADMTMTECAAFPHGTHDDIPDTVSMAIKFLRDNGFAIRRDEHDALERARSTHHSSGPRKAIYPV